MVEKWGGGINRRVFMKIQFTHNFEEIVSIENLLEAWKEFARGKKQKKDVQFFQVNFMENVLSLGNDLLYHTYKHGNYQAFKIGDPKPRDIHKATVRDRLLHHAIYRKLYPFFDRAFITDSYSCRLNKGTHKAIKRFQEFSNIVSKNNTKTCWVLKGDIKKFFANIDHEILLRILSQYIQDENILWLLKRLINSFNAKRKSKVGLPLGNLTSQLFVNIYMNEFDQFVKHKLKIKYYIRYADDFVLFSRNKKQQEEIILQIANFLRRELKLEMHPKKIILKTLFSGVDFLGWVNFPNYRVLRTTTKRRMMKRIKVKSNAQSINSYLGLLSHGNAKKLEAEILSIEEE